MATIVINSVVVNKVVGEKFKNRVNKVVGEKFKKRVNKVVGLNKTCSSPDRCKMINPPQFLEKVNGRLAMNGFVMGTVVQQLNGMSYQEQLQTELPWVLLLSGLITYASYKTDDIEVWPRTKPFLPAVELLNGRVAMLGMLAGFCNSFIH